MLVCVGVGSCLFGGNLPAGITSFQQDGRTGHGEFHSRRFDDSNTGVTLTTNSPNAMDHGARLSGTKAICTTEPLMLDMLAKSATTQTQTHLHGGGHNRLTGTITPDTVCAHHSTFPPISHDHRTNRNMYRLSSYSVRRQKACKHSCPALSRKCRICLILRDYISHFDTDAICEVSQKG